MRNYIASLQQACLNVCASACESSSSDGFQATEKQILDLGSSSASTVF